VAVFRRRARGSVPRPAGFEFFTPAEWQRFAGTVTDYFTGRGEPFTFAGDHVRYGEDGATLGLVGVAQKCNATDPRAWPDLVEFHFRAVLDRDEDLDKVFESDYRLAAPMLKVRLFDSVPLADTAVIARPLTPDLAAVLVLDFPDVVKSVPPDVAEGWSVEEAELWDHALANTRANDAPDVSTTALERGGTVTVLSGTSFLTSAFALDPTTFVTATHGALVAVPNRHCVLLHGIEDHSVIEAIHLLALSADRLFREGPGSIRPTVHWWRDGSWTPIDTEVGANDITVRPDDKLLALLRMLGETFT
jgi:hypothetical protein